MAEFTPEQLAAAKAAKSPEELLAMAKDAGVEMTLEQAEQFLHPATGEISEEELANVAGGLCHDSQGREVVTLVTGCAHSDVYGFISRECGAWGAYTKECPFLSYDSGIWHCNYNTSPRLSRYNVAPEDASYRP